MDSGKSITAAGITKGQIYMKKQYILFDFDGVIVNTEPQNAHYLQETLKSFGVYMDHEELK